jgi:hypothetical protein
VNIAIFWDTAPCSQFVNRRFGGTYHLHIQGKKSTEEEASVQQIPSHLLHADFLFGCSLALKMEEIRFSETWVHNIRTTLLYTYATNPKFVGSIADEVIFKFT